MKASAAFSLFEIVLALGVVAFALVGIMGLFPVAMKSAQESQRETRATLIAQQIFSDLRVLAGTNRLIVCGSSAADASSMKTNFSLAVNGNTEFLAYDQDGAGMTGITGSVFTNGCPSALFLARVEVDAGEPHLSRVQTTIESPAAAPATNRSKYPFVTLISY
jgi:uncharacterized protein (TIGR02598 family)